MKASKQEMKIVVSCFRGKPYGGCRVSTATWLTHTGRASLTPAAGSITNGCEYSMSSALRSRAAMRPLIPIAVPPTEACDWHIEGETGDRRIKT
jgi:hypothetical protein